MSWPRVNFEAALTDIAVEGMGLKQVGHAEATVSSLLDKYATSLLQAPKFLVRTPLAIHFNSWMNNW